MNTLKEWVIQLCYPYTAGVIAIMWLGSSLIAIVRPEMSNQLLLMLISAATIIVAGIGFSTGRR